MLNTFTLYIASCVTGLLCVMSAHAQNSESLAELLVDEHDYIAIPLDRIPTGQLQLIMEINRIEGRFILDTGATATTLDSKSKTKFRITSRVFGGLVAGAGGAGMILEKVNPPYRLELGGIRIQDFELYVTNLDHVNDTFENMGISPVDGVVGADLLTTMNGIIDYRNLVLYLLPED
jgi:hypothetical protein